VLGVRIPPSVPTVKYLVKELVSGNVNFYSCQIASTHSVKLHKLRKHIAALAEKEGNAKDFVSLYVPAETDLEQMVAYVKKQLNWVVSDSEREKERVQNVIKTVAQQLREFGAVSENGLALFAGYNATQDQKDAVTIDTLTPPHPMTHYHFAIDDHFQLEPLREMLRDQKVVGVLALDAKDATLGIVKGDKVELVDSLSSGVSGKTRKGGQSQRRYERERDMGLAYFFHRVAEHTAEAFFKNQINVLIAGGPGQTKNDFLKGKYLHYELDNMLLNTVDTQSAGKEALKEIFGKSAELLNNMCGPEEHKIIQRLSSELAKPNGGLATYGLDAVLGALSKGEVQVALVADDTDVVESVAVCKKCGHTKKQIAKLGSQVINDMARVPCEKCGATTYEVHQKDIVDVLEDMASQTSSAVEVISTESKEKNQLKALSGFAALLRYKTG
jgi:peptide chain release factor subunit 1